VLDISAALFVYRYFERPPMRLLQGIVAGGSADHIWSLSSQEKENLRKYLGSVQG
jgi:hypothetical protein